MHIYPVFSTKTTKSRAFEGNIAGEGYIYLDYNWLASIRMKTKDLWIKVDKILWEKWDPIGVNDYEGPDDEYRGYVPSIVALLQNGADESKITKLLYQHANENMGLSTRLEDHQETAKTLKLLVTKL